MEEAPGWLSRLRDDGAACVGQPLDPGLVNRVEAECDDLVRRFGDGDRSEPFWHYEAGTVTVLYRVHGLEERTDCPAIRTLLQDPEVTALAEVALGREARQTVAALIVKQAEVGAPVPWHRDRPHAAADQAVNLSVYLSPSDETNGALGFVAGSHVDDVSTSPIAVAEAALRGGEERYLRTRRGDVTVHDVRLVHGSGPNPTAEPRLSVVLEFCRGDLPWPPDP